MITRVWKERLSDISEEDAQAEGGYTREEYIRGLQEMHKGKVNPDTVLYCYEFMAVVRVTCSICKEEFWLSKKLADTRSEFSVVHCSEECFQELISPSKQGAKV